MNTFKIMPGIQTGLKAVGVVPATLLRKCGLPLTLFSSGQGMVTTEQMFALWRALGECSDDPAVGLKLASQVPLEQHHPVSIAAHYARTFRDGLQRMPPRLRGPQFLLPRLPRMGRNNSRRMARLAAEEKRESPSIDH
jgi:hypothetical protein